MISLYSIKVGLTALGLIISLNPAAATPVPENQPYGQGCSPTYNVTEYKLDFEDVHVPCYSFQFCPLVTRLNISSPRGQGVAYTGPGMERPLLIPNLGAWQVINCTWEGLVGVDEKYACANNSVRALYSPGKSPFDGSKPRLNTLDFPDTYILGAVKALHFTPIRLPNATKKATLELVGIKLTGATVNYEAHLDIGSGKKQFLISGLKAAGFVNLKVLQLWLVVDGKGGYEFALDDLDLEEYRPLPLPPACTPTPTITIDRGPCTPPPSKTTTWTANAEEFSTSTSVPNPYKSLTWNSWTNILNTSTFADAYMWPPNITTKSNFYRSNSPFQVSAYTQEQRFGIESLSLACGFYQWADPDSSGTNNSPCNITFVGRRDPYDGDGLPSIVMASYSIPNPGRYATTQKFSKINLDRLTNSPGKFSRLSSFTIDARVGAYNYETVLVLDDLVFTRGVTKDERRCRMPGGQELNFDDIKVGSEMQKMPSVYKGFLFSAAWGVNSKNNYAPKTPGSIGAVSPPNELWTGWMDTPDSYADSTIDSYIDPANNFLFDFEEVTITLDLPEYATNKTILADVQISVSAMDACGSGLSYAINVFDRNPYWSSKSFAADKLTITYAEPLHAISRLYLYASLNSGDFRRIEFFIDNFRYRKYNGPTPGCATCGRKGWDRCEVPSIALR